MIQKVQGPVSAAGTGPHKGSVRGRGTYGASAPRGHGVVAGISFCERLNLCCFLEVYDAVASGTAMPARSLLIACTCRCVLESS